MKINNAPLYFCYEFDEYHQNQPQSFFFEKSTTILVYQGVDQNTILWYSRIVINFCDARIRIKKNYNAYCDFNKKKRRKIEMMLIRINTI